MSAAGELEGALTQRRAFEFLGNVFGTQHFSAPLKRFLDNQTAWMRAQVAAHPDDEYWQHVGLSLAHWAGLYAGYKATAPASEALTEDAYFRGTLQGDLADLCSVFPNCLEGGASPGSRRAAWRAGAGHCSALVKAVRSGGAYTELFAGHTTWANFESMTRILKHYDFAIASAGGEGGTVPGRHAAFSSYPSCAVSTDGGWDASWAECVRRGVAMLAVPVRRLVPACSVAARRA